MKHVYTFRVNQQGQERKRLSCGLFQRAEARIRNRSYRGFTLVELIAVMGCLSVIMGVAIVLLFQMFDMQVRTEERSIEIRRVNRFIDVFRKDVHELGRPEIVTESVETEEVLLRWESETATVEYEWKTGEFPGQRFVRRTENMGESIRQTEDYRLPDHSVLQFVEGKDRYAGLVALSLWRQTPGSDIPMADETNPFEKTVLNASSEQDETAYIGMWRTVLAHFDNEKENRR